MQQPRKTKRMFVLILMALLSVAPLAQPARAQQAAQKNVTLNLKSVNVKDFFNEVKEHTRAPGTGKSICPTGLQLRD